MKLKHFAAACLSATAIGVACPAVVAQAMPVTVTYQGLITAGEDVEGLFGGDVSVGDVITAAFLYDTSLGSRTQTSSSDTLTGGYDVFTTLSNSPILSATYTIGQYSYSFAPDYYATVATGRGLFNFDTGASNVSGSSVNATSLAGDVTGVYFNNAGAVFNNLGTSYSARGSGNGYFDTAYDFTNGSDEFTFSTSAVSVSAAPEPASWALMMVGVGLAGMALRRRRAGAPATPAFA